MESLGYPGIILVIFLENVFPPIPSEVILPFAGYLIAQGIFDFTQVVLAATLGAVLGAWVLYMAGQYLGMERIYFFVRKYGKFLTVREENVRKAEEWFTRYGSWTVFFCRMVPILRSLISIPAGLARMSLPVFVGYTAGGTFLWNLALVGSGVLLGAAWPIVSEWVSLYQNAVLFVGILVILGCVFWRLRCR